VFLGECRPASRLPLRLQIHASEQVSEARVRAQRIERWIYRSRCKHRSMSPILQRVKEFAPGPRGAYPRLRALARDAFSALLLSVFSAKWMGELHRRQVDHAESDLAQWDAEFKANAGQRCLSRSRMRSNVRGAWRGKWRFGCRCSPVWPSCLLSYIVRSKRRD